MLCWRTWTLGSRRGGHSGGSWGIWIHEPLHVPLGPAAHPCVVQPRPDFTPSHTRAQPDKPTAEPSSDPWETAHLNLENNSGVGAISVSRVTDPSPKVRALRVSAWKSSRPPRLCPRKVLSAQASPFLLGPHAHSLTLKRRQPPQAQQYPRILVGEVP